MERSPAVEKFLDGLAVAAEVDRSDKAKCISCKQPFTKDNVFTEAGMEEVKISGCCEKCFDAMFGEDDDI